MAQSDVLIRQISAARAVSFSVLEAVAEGAYGSDTLLEKTRSLTSRDAGLASQIVFGSLRYQGQLDYLIWYHSRRHARALDLPVLVALRAALFQLRYLERVPSHAAVHEAVEYVKTRKRSASGFVNAVLRKVDRRPVSWPDLATELSCPAYLLERWTAHFGDSQARAIAAAALVEPQAYIRAPPGAHATALQAIAPPSGVDLQPTSVSGCFRLCSSAPASLRRHDISSQAILPLLGLTAGDTYLDLCAAPGNKTLQALETALGLAVACDISERRLRDVPPVCPRVVLDATQPLPFRRLFNRIFIDSPCSGTGTLSRNPEIKWRVQASDFDRFHRKQVQIVRQALRFLAPQGKLLYATCSLEAEENEDVIAEVLAADPERRCLTQVWRLPGREEGDGFFAALLE
jgi:16S rRNA (cytosine967-C5)-methyltransferase